MNKEKYNVELSKIDIETILDALNYMTDSVRATLLKLKTSKEEFNKIMSELYANQLYREFMLLYAEIERGNIQCKK